MFCANCGKEIPDNLKFCPACGAAIVRLDDNTQVSEPELTQSVQPTVTADNSGVSNANVPVEPVEVKKKSFIRKLISPKLYYPGVIILIIIAVILGRSNQKTAKSSGPIDLALLIDVSESDVASMFGVEVNDFGLYPTEDAITISCEDGSVSMLNLTTTTPDYQNYQFAGVSIGDDITEAESKFMEAGFLLYGEQDNGSDICRAYTNVYGYTLTVMTTADNKITGITYMSEPIEEMWTDTAEVEETEDIDEGPAEEELVEESEYSELTLPDYCVGTYEEDGVYTFYRNENTGYTFGLTDYSSRPMYNTEPEKFEQLIVKLAELSNYTAVEVMIFEEDENYGNISDVTGMYMLDFHEGYEAGPPFIYLSEFYRQDGVIDFYINASDSVYNFFGDDFASICRQIEGQPSISLAFADAFVTAYEQ